MKYVTAEGKYVDENNKQDRLLSVLYGSWWGRALLKPLVCPAVSRVCGCFLDTPVSKVLIRPFIRANRIDMSQYEETDYASYNDFFTRRVRPELRPFPGDPEALPSPCDGKLSAFVIGAGSLFSVKHTRYSLKELLKSRTLAERYEGGLAVILRLTVDDYHRYAYPDSGVKSCNRVIHGRLHTVNPVANDVYPIYKENSREYTMLHTENFGDVIQMEVGALMVGRICNRQGKGRIARGQEKGRFEFGGSTVILLFEKDRVQLRERLLEDTAKGYETVVKMGEVIGWKRK